MKAVSELLFKEGELAKRINRHKIDWPELIFYAEAEREPFADIHVVTLYSHCLQVAQEELITNLLNENTPFANIDLSKKKYKDKIKQLISSIKAREFVDILSDRVVVAVDSETVDDFAIDRALEMIETIESFEVGVNYEFGCYKNYEYKEVDNTTEVA